MVLTIAESNEGEEQKRKEYAPNLCGRNQNAKCFSLLVLRPRFRRLVTLTSHRTQ